MDTQAYARGGSALGSMLRNADLLGGMLASFFLWYANTRPRGFEELAQAFEDFASEVECEGAVSEVVDLGKAEYDAAQ